MPALIVIIETFTIKGEITIESLKEKRRIGNIDFETTLLGLGCWVFGGTQWGGQDDEDSKQALNAALDAGVNHLDTATGYGGGRSEDFLGREIDHKNREQIFLASKANSADKKQMSEAIDASLKRLRTDYIDLYYIHWPRKNADMRSVMEALALAREKGKIRGIGVSNFSVEQMQQAMEVDKIDAHQLCYNLFWRYNEPDVIPFCRANDISVVTYSSIAQGILTGKFGPNPTFKEGDSRSGMVLFDASVWPHVHAGVERMKGIAADLNRPLTHLAIRWVANQPFVDTVLVGARNGEQMKQNAAAMEVEIEQAVFDELTKISDMVLEHVPDVGNIFRFYP